MSPVTIRSEGLTRKFGAITAVHDLTFSVNEGEIYGLVGPDGSGKTTTMRLLSGILTPSSGRAWVDGREVETESEKVKEHIGYMAQRFGLYEDLTVIENIDFYADIYDVPKAERPGRIDELFGFSGLGPFRGRLTRNLSGGMKQKLGLCCSLVHTPRVLFLDEPTNGVDPVSRRDFWEILYRLLKEKVTILYSTSYLDEAERCMRVGLLFGGTLLRSEQPGRIKQERGAASFEEAFVSIMREHGIQGG